MTTRILIGIIIILALILAFLLMRGPREVIKADTARENELAAIVKAATAEIASLRSDLQKERENNAREKESHRGAVKGLKGRRKEVVKNLPSVVVQDPGFQRYRQLTDSLHRTDSLEIARLDKLVEKYDSISTSALRNVEILTQVHAEQLQSADTKLAQQVKETKKERRRKVLSQILGVLAVGATVWLSN